MNLLFVIKTTDSRGGGAERVLTQVTGGLADRGHGVTLLSFDAEGSPDFYPVHPRVGRVWLGAGRPQSATGIYDFSARIRAMRRSACDIGPDIVVGFMHSAYIPAAFALAGTGIPVIGSEHIVYGHYARLPRQRVALHAGAMLCDRITVVSEQAKAGFPARLRQRMTVVPNPVMPTDWIAPPPERRKIVLNVGRLAEQKEQATLIAAFARIAQQYAGWTLRIVGEGPLRAELEAQARRLGVEDRVELPGSTAEIWSEYASAQLFVLSSSYESFGLATAEALSAGLPAIGFADCPGTNELVRDGINGLLISGADRTSALASAMAQLMGSPALRFRMGAAAPATVSKLSIDKVTDRWEALFAEVQRAHARRRWS